MKVPSGAWLAWIAIIGSLAALMLIHNRMGAQSSTLSQSDFFQKYESNQIAQATINYNLQSGNLIEIVGTYQNRQGRIKEASPFWFHSARKPCSRRR